MGRQKREISGPHQAVGIAPNRPNWSGLVPVPGDGRYEWNGFLPIKQLPHVKNPDEELLQHVQRISRIPRGWPFTQALHYVWTDPYRAQSVAEVLGSGRKFAVADMVRLQNNEMSIPARSLTPLFRDLDIDDPVVDEEAADQSCYIRIMCWTRIPSRPGSMPCSSAIC